MFLVLLVCKVFLFYVWFFGFFWFLSLKARRGRVEGFFFFLVKQEIAFSLQIYAFLSLQASQR